MGSFLEKFRKQLEGADDDIYQLAGELLYVQQFFTSLTGQDKKIENVRTVLGWSAHPVAVPEWAIAGVKRGLAGDRTFNQHRPFHLAWLNEFLIDWQTRRTCSIGRDCSTAGASGGTMNRQALAREWLWLVVSLVAAGGIVYGWMAPPDPVSGTVVVVLVTIVVYGLGGFVRLTWWAARTAFRSDPPRT